ncbi:hypothetical protein BC2230_120091 [Burkholderia cepacia]|uniref:hypothetical protein n=1 Tax=Burkholderia cepacia TaxID=292 RepID=UPI0039A71474
MTIRGIRRTWLFASELTTLSAISSKWWWHFVYVRSKVINSRRTLSRWSFLRGEVQWPIRKNQLGTMNALEIVESLAKGIDPLSGEILSEHGSLNDPTVIRALFEAANALRTAAATCHQNVEASPKPSNAGHAWPPEEDTRLLANFDAGVTPEELARKHGRTTGAIKSRLVKHGRIKR